MMSLKHLYHQMKAYKYRITIKNARNLISQNRRGYTDFSNPLKNGIQY